MSDTKAISQFIKKGVAGEDIVLKSEGTQLYSYNYVADAVSGILTCLFYGKCGEAYNISDDSCDIRLRDLALIIADYADKNVVFEIPDSIESEGYSKATKAILDNSKLKLLGWNAQYNMNDSLKRTMDIIRKLDA
jgi:nucleoside-diphosphate-sugar epimerase